MEKNVGQFVASQLQIPVGINCAIINNKRLVGDSLRLLDKPVQHCTHAGCQFKQLQPHSVPDHLHQKEEIPPEVREAEFLHNISGKETCGQRIEPAQSCAHVKGSYGKTRWTRQETVRRRLLLHSPTFK
ncbi:hypothetical protein ILYODFUR_004680, partial [Ilyodon furcidens]